MTTEQVPALSISNLSMQYHPASPWVLKDLDFMVKKGEFVVILGPSGSGKSTLLRLIAGFEIPARGSIRLNGKQVAAAGDPCVVPPEARGIGYVFQAYALWPHKTVAQNIAFPLEMRHLAQLDIRRQVADVMEKLGISALERRYPAQLSGGQRQRVALARALIGSPGLLIMDEPLSSLDVSLRRSIQRELLDLRAQWQPTVLYVTHDQEEAMRLADRIIVLHAGRIQQQGTAAELYHSPRNAFVAQFFGAASFFDGVVVDASAGCCQVAIPGMATTINTRSSNRLATGSSASVLLRPNWLRLLSGSEQTTAAGGFSAVVSHLEFLGQHTSYRFSWRDSEFSVIESRAPRFRVGEAVQLTVEDAWSIPCVKLGGGTH